MRYIDYMQLNPFQKFGYNFTQFFKKLPGNLARFFKFLGRAIVHFFVAIGKGIAGYGKRFVKGDIFVKISYLVFGVSNMVRGQIIKGLIFLLTEAAYISFMIFFAWNYISKINVTGTAVVGGQEVQIPNSLGYIAKTEVYTADGFPETKFVDDSMLILLYSVLTIVVTIIFFAIYIANTKSAYKVYEAKKNGETIPGFKEEIKAFFDEKFHITLMSLPCLLIGAFTVLPLIFMILIAFTTYDKSHLPPGNLFQWAGLNNFGELVNFASGDAKSRTFLDLAGWTIIWAIFATFSNYILGMVVALMINKKGIKLKALWRTLFVVVVAVPQFVSLLLMAQILAENGGAMNQLIEMITGNHTPVKFLNGTPLAARITVIVVNIWVGIPYTILITSGILMNIPADLYESATIDGAGPVKSFTKITLPYMLFVTTPYLITSFIGNINNFNVIYLLTGGGPSNPDYFNAGYTDILVTWLFNLTMGEKQDYKLAAAIGILVFIVCATLSLITFNMTKSAKDEEAFS
ncbi:MAG: sugar ABC transporter permease [Ruminococcus sp.]|nr:sugar ABC transporter permease [Ruminococcus sp.]